MSVRRARIGDVLTLARRRVHVDQSSEYREIGLRSFGKGVFHKPSIPGSMLGSKRVFAIREGDLLLSNVFAWEGAVAVAGQSENDRIGSHRFMTWVPQSCEVDVMFLYHYFVSDSGLGQLRNASPGSAGRNRTLGIRAFEDLVIPLPIVGEQRAIAIRLDAVAEVSDAMIESASNLNSTLSALRQQIFQVVTDRSAQVPVDEILAQVHRRVDVRSDASYEMLGVRSFARGAFASGILAGSDTSYAQLRRVDAGDLVYPKLMAWEGAFAVVPQELGGRHVSPEFCIFRMTDTRADPEYLKHLFAWPEFLASVSGGATGTNVRRRRLQPGDFLKTKLPLPEISVQRELVAKLDLISMAVDIRARQASLARALPQSARNEVFSKLV